MPTLDDILRATRSTLVPLRARRAQLERDVAKMTPPRQATLAMRGSAVALIAEVKRRSPSAGAINETLDPVELAKRYVAGGATMISVLTDEAFFGGSISDLVAVADAVPAPVLRKDFILDEVQLLEARASGAAAALLIVRALHQDELVGLIQFARDLDLTALVEAHTREELTRALDAGADVIGVNARDLDTFTINTAAAWEMLATIPADRIAVAESGMATRDDVISAANAGAHAVLIGSALAAAPDPAALAASLVGVPRRER